MKRINLCLAILMVVPLQTTQAAYQTMPVKTRFCIIENGGRRYEISRTAYNFRVEVISDTEGLKAEHFRGNRPWITAQPEELYAVRLYNPLPVRAAVNLTVDGINSISGKPSGIKDGHKWLIEPYSFITIRGWQVNGEEARRFFFTEKPKSYAQWRGDELGKDLSANCGVIGAAFFWSQKELDAYYEAHPQYRYPPCATPCLSGTGGALQDGIYGDRAKRSMRAQAAPEAASSKDQLAGTGMGERESNPTQLVEFDYDTGMYRLSQAIVLYYDFAETPAPNPFPALSYAPEMP